MGIAALRSALRGSILLRARSTEKGEGAALSSAGKGVATASGDADPPFDPNDIAWDPKDDLPDDVDRALSCARYVKDGPGRPLLEVVVDIYDFNIVRDTITGESRSWSTVGKLKKKLHDNDDGHPDEKKKTPKKSVVNSVAAGKPRGRKAKNTKKEDKEPHQGKYYDECVKDFPEGIARSQNVSHNHKGDKKSFLRITGSKSLFVKHRELCLPLKDYDQVRCANCWTPLTWNSVGKHGCHPPSDFTIEVMDIPLVVPPQDSVGEVVRRKSRRLAGQGLDSDSQSGSVGKD